ncbi:MULTISPECIES: hypothetical protein [unclassified Polynucleobacter]|uniref:hypothetical protein n=1 Tax=unclassified Polynucleobacter TaxID=2640945 RepID=UPI001C0C4EA7|nr:MULTISPECIES: hypothetical protein [unclassified Polynucleobacter]MBU3591212.1 hypothetical protein [Polynucleobacter sp. 78F-HAINBA]
MTLRLQLEQMTEAMPLSQHSHQIEVLRTEFGHTINIVDSEIPVDTYTCAVHSFGLIDDPTYVGVASHGLGNTFAGADFIYFLLSQNLILETSPESVAANDFIFYFDGDKFMHVGKILGGGRILSKWGSGLLYDHSIWEVPSGYGQTIRCFEGLDSDRGVDLFITYAESRGFQFHA